MRRVVGILLASGLALAIAVAALVVQASRWLHAPLVSLTAPAVYEVPRGASWQIVMNDLHARGWLEHPRELSLWVRYFRRGYSLKAGEYQLVSGMSPMELIELFNSGRVLLHSLTIIEGSTFAELRRSLRSNADIGVTLEDATDQEVMRRLGMADMHPEGRFFPDTYLFAKGTTDLELLRLAQQRMQAELDKAWASRDPALPLADATQALILASIVEKETALAGERPLIAGVFVERLQRGMRLQTDPTVIYGMGERFDGNLRRGDLLADTPYNTYTRVGLPPTPICLPGAAALAAAVRPKRTGALFFVATGNADGGHYFSKTLVEHNAAVQRYLRKLRSK